MKAPAPPRRSGGMMGWRIVVLALVGLCSLVIGARPAQACKCGGDIDVAFVSSPYVDQGHGLQLRAHSASLRCDGKRTAPQCEYEAAYEIHNPSAEAVQAPAVIMGSIDTSPLVRIDGAAPPEREAGELDQRAFEDAFRSGSSEGRQLSQRSFVLEVKAGETVQVTVQTPLTPTDTTCDCGMLQIERRHIVLSKDLRTVYRAYHVTGFGLAGIGQPERTTDLPLRWIRDRLFATTTRRRYPRGRRVIEDRPSPASDPSTWHMETRPPLLWGGPFAAVGVGWRKDPGLLLRGGWEVGRPAWLVTSFAVETDAQTHVELVPTLEVTFPAWGSVLAFFPAPGVGLGAPVQVVPRTRAGVRTHLSLSWHVFSILGVVDVYPTQRGMPGRLFGGLMFQFGI